ncbi:TonB-dependent receptor [Luminiphilus syltensis NOR5-1B]|uniref:TonB-dependent receptor n=1 Tax=Luminiphilus syltensis NOR5-1B TaxID=565045 RepID=B8KVK7_9GAMM|nr:TonB-dependent receptor [Luminiphilus syltensis NOR5-1B]
MSVRAAVLEEIVVTAQKRAASLQDTPIAITAFTASALQDKGVNDISEIAYFTPNLVFDTTSPIGGVSSGAAVFIRGVGNTDFSLTTDPGVGTYVDGVYVSRSVGGVLDVLDVERIEVLRGPQGTLFGRNTIGGAINIISRKPADDFQAFLEATAGIDGRVNVRASVDVPISETLKTAWSVSSKNRDGFVKRPLAGDELGDEDRLSFRGAALFKPNENWDFQASVDYTDIDESSSPSVGVGFTAAFPDGTPGGAGVVGASLVENFSFPLPTGNRLGPLAPGSLSPTGDFFEIVGGGLNIFNQFVVDDIDADVSFGDQVAFSKIEVLGTTFIANYHGDTFDLKYTGSYRNTESKFANDSDNAPFQITEIVNDNYDVDQTTHELQLTGTAFENHFKYAAGIFFFNEKGTDDVRVPVTIPAPGTGPGGGAGFEAAIRNDADVDNSSEAAYLQATYDLTDTWAVTGGIRYTEDEKKYAYTQNIGANLAFDPLLFLIDDVAAQLEPGGPLVPGYIPIIGDGTGSVSETFDETQYYFGVDTKLNDNTLLYYSFSQGFKSGGFVLRYVASVPEVLSFDPETLDSHEVGLKWESADSRYRVNAALFASEYDDIQVTFFDTLGGPLTANAGSADINGFELEATAFLTSSLRLDLGYGYVDAEYTEINPIPGLSAAITKDSKLVNTPENTLSLGLEYATTIASKDATFRIDYSYTDEVYNDSQNSPFLYQESVSFVNASARLDLTENSEVVLWVENLGDERVIVSGNSNFGLGFHSAVPNRPREYGVTYRHRF